MNIFMKMKILSYILASIGLILAIGLLNFAKKNQLLISNLKCQGQIVNFSYQVQGQIIIKNKPQSNIDRCLNKVSYKCLLLCYF